MLKQQIHGWITAARPKTLPAAVTPILPAAALAWSENSFKLLPVFTALIICLLLQIAVNIANDYFDFIHGIDTQERIGPPRAAASGLLSLKAMRIGMFIITIAILGAGSYLVHIGGIPILLIGVASVLSVYLYSAGPLPFSTNALGDLFVFIFFGPVAVCGTYFLQTKTLNTQIILFSISIGFLITAIMVVNNYRDIKTDTAAGKKTLAVILGTTLTRLEYLILIFTPYLILIAMKFLTNASLWLLLPLPSIFLWLPLLRDMNSMADSQNLNKTLAATAKISLIFSVLLSLGIILSS
ncbi:MAG: 1,4-dihydroxy-2-naphthoate polyprenyltransferase [Desulfobacula sp.]|nr:1,4-dihydroxy-2-naphthoate polyprenyltransferase [Desulfobacula sp.]